MEFTSLHALLNLHVHACFQTATQIVLFYTSHFGLGIEKPELLGLERRPVELGVDLCHHASGQM